MHADFRRTAFALGCTLLLALTGCKTADVSPARAKPGYGYADFYTEPAADVWWKVEVFDPARGNFKEFTAQYNAPQSGVLRVQAKPGRHRARVTFQNATVQAPAEVEAEIREGMITPIKVVLTPAGESVVRSVQERINRERMRITDYPNRIWKISAEVGAALPFMPKEQAPYGTPGKSGRAGT